MSNTYTSFPESTQLFDLLEDVSIETFDTWTQYNTYWSTGNIDDASALYSSSDDLQKTILTAFQHNKLTKTVEAIQDFINNTWLSHVVQVVQNKGDWNQSTQYKRFDFVTYNGQSYMGFSNSIPIGTIPTNTTYWVSYVLKGDAGAPGLNLAVMGEWNSSTTYTSNKMVTYNGSWWASIVSNTNSVPSDSNSNWLRISNFTAEQVSFDNTTNGMMSTNVQDAIEEVAENISLSMDGFKLKEITQENYNIGVSSGSIIDGQKIIYIIKE